jgi:hypothetical protein
MEARPVCLLSTAIDSDMFTLSLLASHAASLARCIAGMASMRRRLAAALGLLWAPLLAQAFKGNFEWGTVPKVQVRNP